MDFAYPDAYVQADRASVRAQRRFLAATRGQLILLLAAGVTGTFSWEIGRYDLAAFAVATLFGATALVRWQLIRCGLVERWHDARAAAESLKTLSWRFAVGGTPFDIGPDVADAFESRCSEVLAGLPRLRVPRTPGDMAPTPAMTSLRGSPFEDRRAAFLAGRIGDQQGWYGTKAAWNSRRAKHWGQAILALQLAAAGGAVLKGFGVIDFEAFDIAAALMASGAAWLATKQHSNLAASYAIAADELREIAAQAVGEGSESAWAAYVADAEEAISREHTMWLASARARRPVDIT